MRGIRWPMLQTQGSRPFCGLPMEAGSWKEATDWRHVDLVLVGSYGLLREALQSGRARS